MEEQLIDKVMKEVMKRVGSGDAAEAKPVGEKKRG